MANVNVNGQREEVCSQLDTAIIRCQPAQEDEVRAELKKMREAHSGLSNRRWKKVIDC